MNRGAGAAGPAGTGANGTASSTPSSATGGAPCRLAAAWRPDETNVVRRVLLHVVAAPPRHVGFGIVVHLVDLSVVVALVVLGCRWRSCPKCSLP